MASGNRDVELVIRAKNEASKALDAVTSALDTLTKAQADTAKGSEKTGDLLAQLGAQLGKLQQQVAGASTLDRLAGSMERAAGAVARLETSTGSLTDEQAQLAAEVKVSENALGDLIAKALNLQQVLNQQAGATAKAKAEFNDLSAEVKSGESALNKTVQNSQAYERELVRLEKRLATTQQRHRDLTVAILNAEEPSKKLIASFEKTDAALIQQTTALAKARTAYAQTGTATKTIEDNLARLRLAQAESAAAFDKAKASQDATATSLREVGVATKEAEKNLSGLRGAAADNAVALERQDAALSKAREELLAVETAANQANVSLEKIGVTVRQGLLRSLVDSQTQLQKYRTEWVQATAAIKQAVASGADVSNPTPELSASIAAAQKSKAAYQELQVAIQQMRTSVRDAGTDVVKLTSAQQTYIAALDRVDAKVKEVTVAQQQAAGAANAASQSSVAAATRQANAYQSVATSVNKMGSEARNAGSGLDSLASKGRAALSWGERLRSEMIALATAFVGVYSAIQQLSNVTQTFQDMQAVTQRLNVAFEGNAAIVGREFRFIQQEADRLGIDIRVLAGEYSKLSIATKGSALEGEQTRKVFISLAEAFRVNNLSANQMEGAFLAVTQMVSKGNVSMEELRQQLGERLYGAFTLAAKAMGLTGAEFSKLVASGQLATDQFLPKLAEELDKTFGPQLPAALQSLSADIGRFGNEVTKAQMKVAQGGFVDGLRSGLQSLTEFFQSKEGEQFFSNLGAAAGGLIKVLALVPKYIDEISIVLSVLIGRKAAGWVGDLISNFTKFRATLVPLTAGLKTTTVAVDSMGIAVSRYEAAAAPAVPLTTRLTTSVSALAVSTRAAVAGMTAASVASSALTGALTVLRGALAALGGPVGLIVTGLTVAFGYWLTSTNDVIDATEEHRKQMEKVIDAYNQAKDKAGDWAKEVKGVSLAGAEQNLNDLKNQLTSQTKAIVDSIGGAVKASQGFQGKSLFGDAGDEVIKLSEQLRAGEITVKQYREALDQMLRTGSVNDALRGLIQRTSQLTTEAVDSEKAVSEQAIIVEKLGGTVTDVSPKVRELAGSMDDLAAAAGLAGDATQSKLIDPAEALGKLLDQLKGKVPSLTAELKLMEQVKEIDEILKTADAIKGLDKTSEAYKRLVATATQAKTELQNAFDASQFKDSFNLLAQGGTGTEIAAALLRQVEGFQGTAKFDVNAFRAGFGSDTVTLADGTIQKITEGMKVSVEDANRDLVRRIGEFQNTIRGQIGSERFNSFNPQQQAVLTSVAYNYGSLPQRIIEAVRMGSADEIANAIRSLAGDNNGVNAKRRNREAFLFQSSGDSNAQATQKMVDDELKAAEKRTEQEKQYHDRLADTLALKQQEAETGKRRTLQEEINIALAKTENDAKKAGTALTEQEKQTITETTTVLYQRKAAEQAITDQKKQQEEGEKRINLLTQLRRDLIEQMKFTQQNGDNEQFTTLQQKIADVDTQLQDAIAKMIAFWQASSDPEAAAAAIANLQNLQNSLQKTNQVAILSSFNVGKLLGDSIANFGDNFLAKIKETGDVLGSLKESFQEFASTFLLNLAQMILKQAILNALMAAFGGSTGGFGGGILSAFGVTAGVNHTGGVVGDQGNASRTVSPAWFVNAMRYHSGGVAGLKPDEVPTILQKGEEVLPADDPRHRNNGGGAGGGSNVKIVNAIDSGSFVSEGMSTAVGQQAVLNFIKTNASAVKGALG